MVVSTKCYNMLIFFAFVSLVLLDNVSALTGVLADPTNGFVAVPLTESNFEIQKPYDVPVEQRYSFVNGVRRLWVYADDKPHDPNSRTQPRTEIRIRVCTRQLSYSIFLSSSHPLHTFSYKF